MSHPGEKSKPNAVEIRRRLDFNDARLLAECEVHTHRVGGPGGQHRNKTETAIRLVHRPSGLVVTAGETRSQHENRQAALWRLREAIAVAARTPLLQPVMWPDSVVIRERRLRVSDQNAGYPQAVAIALDALATCVGNVAQAAEAIGVTTSSLTRFLADHPRAWIAANAIREQNGLTLLRNSN